VLVGHPLWLRWSLSSSSSSQRLDAGGKGIGEYSGDELSSTSASGLPREPRVSSCVSSPKAKYASCSWVHGSQKGIPRISTTAEREQGFPVLLRTWHGPGFVALLECLSFTRS
jgi:hypothetical protein